MNWATSRRSAGQPQASSVVVITKGYFVAGAAGMLWGYLLGALSRQPRYEEPGFRAYLRRWQRWSLLIGKRRATERCERAAAARWRPQP